MGQGWTVRLDPEPASTSDVSAPNAATAAVVTLPAVGPDAAHVIEYVICSYDSTPTGGNLQISDGGTNVVFNEDIPTAGVFTFEFEPALECTPGNDVTITLASGAGSVKGKIAKVGHRVLTNVGTFNGANFAYAVNAALEAALD